MTLQQTEIGNILEDLCNQKGWSAAQLSTAAGLGKNAVGDIIEGRTKSPRKSTLAKLAIALEIDVAILTGEPSFTHLSTLLEFDPENQQLVSHFPSEINEVISNLISHEPGKRQRFIAKNAIPSLGIPKGAHILINIETEPKTGDIVAAQKSGSTHMCYWVEPFLICLGAEGEIHHFLNDQSVEILGKVEFSGHGIAQLF